MTPPTRDLELAGGWESLRFAISEKERGLTCCLVLLRCVEPPGGPRRAAGSADCEEGRSRAAGRAGGRPHRKADLERQERELLAAARAELLKEQQALEDLKKKVTDCGIDVNEPPVPPPAPVVSRGSPAPAEQPAVPSN